jgi:hypothetical protein
VITLAGIDPRSPEEDAVRRFEMAVKDYGFSFTDEEITRFYSANALEFFKDVL